VNTDHNSGSPETASPEILALMKERIAPFRQRRLDATARAARGSPEFFPRMTAQKKKAARFPRRPFLSYGGATLKGDFRTSAPGPYLPALS
jgi:hypothetical protein